MSKEIVVLTSDEYADISRKDGGLQTKTQDGSEIKILIHDEH